MDQSTRQWELALKSAMQQCMDAVVRAANADAALLEGSEMKENQIRNVLTVADESCSLIVLTNFIRYQMGRAQTGSAWRHERGGSVFGLRVIEQIETPQGIVHQQARQVLEALGTRCPVLPEGIADRVRYELVRHYLGYLNRAFIYGSKVKGAWDDLRQSAKTQEA